MIIVDASVAVKWVVSESGSTEAAALLDGDRLGAPTLWLSEASNALWAKVMRQQLTAEEARGQAADLADAPIVPLALPGCFPSRSDWRWNSRTRSTIALPFRSHTERHACGDSGSAVLREGEGPAPPSRPGGAASRLSAA
jgi:hypothetical protein